MTSLLSLLEFYILWACLSPQEQGKVYKSLRDRRRIWRFIKASCELYVIGQCNKFEGKKSSQRQLEPSWSER